MPNRLGNESSPYLLQHKENPVDWYPWGEEALQRAQDEDKPIFLSIGYAACHWCHVMEHESFEDPEVAALMNENFINIKVDREERPELDNIYMNAVVAMTGQGGWPMSVFLTPDTKPFLGGTYFPPVRRYNMPSFREVLLSVIRTWETDRPRVDQASEQMTGRLSQELQMNFPSETLQADVLSQAALVLAQNYDWQNGGWGKAPKFPQPMAIEFLLSRSHQGDKMALDIAQHALRAMSRGGMYDVVGGGFHRYSVDDFWLVPHFEKMLYDNALLSRAYLHGYLITKDPLFLTICTETLDYVLREMTHPLGGFFSSLDADSEGEEGTYYIWALDEIRQILPEGEDAAFLEAAYGITAEGNFEGANILQRLLADQELAEKFQMAETEVPERLKGLHARLLESRGIRVRPGTDDKVLTSWNGLMLISLAEAARYLKRDDYLEAAKKNANFLINELRSDDRLLRSWREGTARHNGYLEDYAAVILALVAIYQTDPDPKWYSAARKFTEEMVAHFSDPQGGFFDTRDDHESLLVRPKDVQDNATPSGNALATTALLHMAALEGSGSWRDRAEQSLGGIQTLMKRYPTAFGQWLAAHAFAIGPAYEVAILGNQQDPEMDQLIEALWESFRPYTLAAISDYPPDETSPTLLANRPLMEEKTTAYVCQNMVCKLPVTAPQELTAQLSLI